MKKGLLLAGCMLISGLLTAQSFELSALQDTYRGSLGELIKVPLKIKNTTEKPLILIIKRTEIQIGSSQKSLFCPDNTCADLRTEEFSLRIDPGQTLQNFSVALEAGLVEGFSVVKYTLYNKSNPTDHQVVELNYQIEGKPEKTNIYSSRFITIHDVYPNPVTTFANIDYQLHSEEVKTKIVIHNILGNALKEYELPYLESKVKIQTDELTAGIYFYTLYIDNEGVMTRKLIIRK